MNERAPPLGYQELHSSSLIGFGRSVGPTFVDRLTHRLAFRVGSDHVNLPGVCNGGAMATFADGQIVAVFEQGYEAAGHAPTITLSVDYIAPAPLGALVEMQVALVRKTGTMLFTQAVITVADQTIARSNAIYRHFYRRS